MRIAKAALLWLIMGAVYLLRPFVKVRFGALFVSRLGHLAANTECYLCERDAGMQPRRTFDIWVPMGEPANRALLRMFSRCMRMWPWASALADVGATRLEWFRREHTFSDANWGRDIHNLLEVTPPHIRLTRSEERRGQKGLRELGIPEGAKWVCMIARDSTYLAATGGGADYSYHDFRDSKIDNYRLAALALMERGYYVVRMGTYCAPMHLVAPQFIDYAVSGKRTEFMDVYLGAKCEFCITNGTGFDGIPMIFRRPLCFVNEAPFGYLSTWCKDSLAIWKHHETDAGRFSVERIVECGAHLFDRSQQFKEAGIRLVENTPEEIRDVVLEMLEAGPRFLEDQSAFWRRYPLDAKNPHNGLPLHGRQRLRIGREFLRAY